MTDWKLNLYHSVPPFFRTLIASAHGYNLRRWRYGRETEALTEEYLEHETWSMEKWRKWREEKLAFVLHRAATKVPYYREQWNQRRRHGDTASWEYLENWRILSKESVRSAPTQFIADDCDIRKMYPEHTSGTTGKPLTLWLSKDSVRQWYALFDARWRGWYGLSRHDRWGIFGGQMVAPFSRSQPPFWVWNAGMNQLYLSSYHLAPQNCEAYINAIKTHQLVYLWGYASSLYSLAWLTLGKNLNLPALKAVISNAEPLYNHQRETIAMAFQCPVYDTYGLSENVCAASECLHGNLHLWAEVGVTEILDDSNDTPLLAGETGRIICTGFLNLAMPLIRYDVGDRGFISNKTSCACGRNLPILGGIEGRKDDMIYTRDGRLIGRLDPVFKTDMVIKEAQIIQESLDRILVRYVPAPGCSTKDLNLLIERLQERLGKMEIVFEKVERIPRSPNGKFRAVISNVRKYKDIGL